MAVNDAAGRRTRNLIARSRQPKGSAAAAWDLKDEEGHFVPPGVYRWTALLCPDLQLRYETTVYPNVRSTPRRIRRGSTAARAAAAWLADHSPPAAVCAVGDQVYLSATCAESGVSLIECDLEGRKQLGPSLLRGLDRSAHYMASDGKQLFVAAQVLGTTADSIWTVDLAARKVGTLLTQPPTATRLRGMQGLAAQAGQVYLSVRSSGTWLENAASADNVNVSACLPLYRRKREPRVAHEFVPDPRNEFLRLFRLTSFPPGGETQYTLSYLETMGGLRPQQHIMLAFQKPCRWAAWSFPCRKRRESA